MNGGFEVKEILGRRDVKIIISVWGQVREEGTIFSWERLAFIQTIYNVVFFSRPLIIFTL